MAKKLGTLVKEARSAAGLSQTALAAKVDGLSAADVGKVERGEKIPSQTVIRGMAKALGVTQTSLLNASDVAGSKKTSSSKTSSSKTSSSKTSSSKTASAKKTTSSKKTATSSSGDSMKVTATEKKLLAAYRKADSSTKKAVMNILEGDGSIADILTGLFAGKAQGAAKDSIGSIIGDVLGKIKK